VVKPKIALESAWGTLQTKGPSETTPLEKANRKHHEKPEKEWSRPGARKYRKHESNIIGEVKKRGGLTNCGGPARFGVTMKGVHYRCSEMASKGNPKECWKKGGRGERVKKNVVLHEPEKAVVRDRGGGLFRPPDWGE